MKTYKILFPLLLVACLILSVGIVAHAAKEGFTMTYLPGTTDTVTNLPGANEGTGGESYTVSSQIPQREGYEFICWTLDYGVAYKVTYVVNPDPTYGTPEGSEVPTDSMYVPGETVDVANQLTTTVDYALVNDEKIYGTWTFGSWDKDDFRITEDTTITGGWTFTPGTYKVTYVVNPDTTYGTPEDSEVPEDLHEYAWKETVDVKDQLTSAQDYAMAGGEKIPGTWTFKEWDKEDDFQITEDTTITGGWTFTPKTYKVTYVVNPDNKFGTPEGSEVPKDLKEYEWKEMVDVHDQLTTTVDYAYNENDEKVRGTWEFETWDKDDFAIYEDTTITGGWSFEPAPAEEFHYIVEYRLWDGKNIGARVAPDEEFTIDSLGITVTTDAIPIEKLKKPYCNKDKNGKYLYRIVTPSRTNKISYDGYIITILYEKIPKGM